MAFLLGRRYAESYVERLNTATTFDYANENAPLVNRNYNIVGNAKKGGIVEIPRLASLVLEDYDRVAGLTLTGFNKDFYSLTITNDKALNKILDQLEKEDVGSVKIVGEVLNAAAEATAVEIDKDFISTISNGGTIVVYNDDATKDNIADRFYDIQETMTNVGVPEAGRYTVLSALTRKLVLKSPDFVKASEMGQEMLAKGVIGEIAGFVVYVTNRFTNLQIDFVCAHGSFVAQVEELVVPPYLADLTNSENHVGANDALKARTVYEHGVLEQTAVQIVITSATSTGISGSDIGGGQFQIDDMFGFGIDPGTFNNIAYVVNQTTREPGNGGDAPAGSTTGDISGANSVVVSGLVTGDVITVYGLDNTTGKVAAVSYVTY